MRLSNELSNFIIGPNYYQSKMKMIKNLVFASMLFIFFFSMTSCSKDPIKEYPQTFVCDRSEKIMTGIYAMKENYSIVESSLQSGLLDSMNNGFDRIVEHLEGDGTVKFKFISCDSIGVFWLRTYQKSQYYYFDEITSDFILPGYNDYFSMLKYDAKENEIRHRLVFSSTKKYCPASSDIKTKIFIFSPNDKSMEEIIWFGGSTEYFQEANDSLGILIYENVYRVM